MNESFRAQISDLYLDVILSDKASFENFDSMPPLYSNIGNTFRWKVILINKNELIEKNTGKILTIVFKNCSVTDNEIIKEIKVKYNTNTVVEEEFRSYSNFQAKSNSQILDLGIEGGTMVEYTIF